MNIRYLTLTQAAQRTGIKRITLQKQAERGEIPGARIQTLGALRAWVIPENALPHLTTRPYRRREPMET